METITISASNARAALEKADNNFKPVLEALLGLNSNPLKWEDIKTFEAACMVIPPTDDEQYILNNPGTSNAAKASVAHTKLSIISRAMNKLNNNGQEWQPDWTNSNEYKYYPWLKYVAGSGFSGDVYLFDCTYTVVGSRLCFMTSDMARHAAVHFQELYNELFTL